ncbi:hypothetical protein HKX48_001656 [Thoreauomyces humboldtii]|nr:hypothetical protein HKX48_001656 [Thoreauomyces humboldtii]
MSGNELKGDIHVSSSTSTSILSTSRRLATPPTALVLCTEQTLPTFLAFAARHNSLPSQHCLHLRSTVEGIRSDLADFETDPFRTWWGHFDRDGGMMAMLGYDLNLERATAPLHGPFGVDVRAIRRVVRDVLGTVPKAIREIIAYQEASATDVMDVLEEEGFKKVSVWKTLEVQTHLTHGTEDTAVSADWPSRGSGSIRLVVPSDSPVDTEAVMTLHHACFTNPSVTRETMSDFDGVSHNWLFGFFESTHSRSSPIGYAIVCREGDTSKACIEYVGISESERNKGRGTQMMTWIQDSFDRVDGIDALRLTVNSEKTHAIKMYLKTGFRVTEEGHALIYERDDN